MLLKSSSTPVLGSLLPSFSDSPNNNSGQHQEPHTPVKQGSVFGHNRISFSQHCLSCNSSPSLSDHFSQNPRSGLFRRTQSEGNLEALVSVASCNAHNDSGTPKSSNHISRRSKNGSFISLETIPSFTFHNSRARFEEDEEESEENDFGEEVEEIIAAVDHIDLEKRKDRDVVMDRKGNVGSDEDAEVVAQSLFLARGLGVDGGDGGSGGSGGGWVKLVGSGGDGGDNQRVEEYYKWMLKENPSNALFLRNYAKFLCQIKEDLHGAEEYYSRAILLDPDDGDTLSQYAKLVWELYGDEERASIYFERAVHASPKDSHVHAAYASFLWETEEDEDGCDAPQNLDFETMKFHESATASAKG